MIAGSRGVFPEGPGFHQASEEQGVLGRGEREGRHSGGNFCVGVRARQMLREPWETKLQRALGQRDQRTKA